MGILKVWPGGFHTRSQNAEVVMSRPAGRVEVFTHAVAIGSVDAEDFLHACGIRYGSSIAAVGSRGEQNDVFVLCVFDPTVHLRVRKLEAERHGYNVHLPNIDCVVYCL